MTDRQLDRVTGALKQRVPVTAAGTDLPNGTCRCLIVSKDCLLNVMEEDGLTVRTNVQFFKGYNPCVVRQVRTGADAAMATIEAGY